MGSPGNERPPSPLWLWLRETDPRLDLPPFIFPINASISSRATSPGGRSPRGPVVEGNGWSMIRGTWEDWRLCRDRDWTVRDEEEEEEYISKGWGMQKHVRTALFIAMLLTAYTNLKTRHRSLIPATVLSHYPLSIEKNPLSKEIPPKGTVCYRGCPVWFYTIRLCLSWIKSDLTIQGIQSGRFKSFWDRRLQEALRCRAQSR